MYTLYLDESGELGVARGSSEFFLITVLSTDNPKALKNRMRKEKKRLYDLGWPRNIEVKGTSLYRSQYDRRIPTAISRDRIDHLSRVISRIVSDSVYVHYVICRKSKLAQHFLVFGWPIFMVSAVLRVDERIVQSDVLKGTDANDHIDNPIPKNYVPQIPRNVRNIWPLLHDVVCKTVNNDFFVLEGGLIQQLGGI